MRFPSSSACAAEWDRTVRHGSRWSVSQEEPASSSQTPPSSLQTPAEGPAEQTWVWTAGALDGLSRCLQLKVSRICVWQCYTSDASRLTPMSVFISFSEFCCHHDQTRRAESSVRWEDFTTKGFIYIFCVSILILVSLSDFLCVFVYVIIILNVYIFFILF